MSEPGQSLGASLEAAWHELRIHSEWARGFWVAWMFTHSPRTVHELEERMEASLAEHGWRQLVLRPETPEAVKRLLEVLLSDGTRDAHCVWVEVLRSDLIGPIGIDPGPGSWSEAWDWLMMRANEHRGRLSTHLPGGLVFVTTPALKPRTAPAAPDLWSIRSLVLEPAALPLPAVPLRLPIQPAMRPDPAPDPELALEQAARMREQGHQWGEAVALVRASEGLFARSQTTSVETDDVARALDVNQQAIALLRELAEEEPERALPMLSMTLGFRGLLLRAHRADAALAAQQEAIAIYRSIEAQENAPYLVGMAANFVNMANTLRHLGRHVEAVTAAQEGVTLWRELEEKYPGGYGQWLARGLVELAHSLEVVDRHAEALSAAQESVTLYRRLNNESPATYGVGLVLSLATLGRILTRMGRWPDATAALEVVSDLFRRLVQSKPSTYLPFLRSALDSLAHIYEYMGLLESAQQAREEAAQLASRLGTEQP